MKIIHLEMKKMSPDTPCTAHEEQIQSNSRKIAELETRADYKEKMIDSVNNKMEKMDNKLDELLDGFNDFKIQSKQDDAQLELRLKAIETEQQVLKDTDVKNREDSNRRLALVTLILGFLTFYFNFMK